MQNVPIPTRPISVRCPIVKFLSDSILYILPKLMDKIEEYA